MLGFWTSLGGEFIKNRLIGVTFFEEQLLRVFLLSDNFQLLRNLLTRNDVLIFTRPDLKERIESLLKLNGFESISVLVFKDTNETVMTRLLSFILRWIDPSTGTLRVLYREREYLRITSFGLMFRKMIYIVFSNIPKLKISIRYLYIVATRSSYLKKSFSKTPPKLDLLFITSLTNIESDLQIGIFYKKKNTPVIATVRSWDNLVTKGILRLSPDIFLSHSKYMSEIAIQNHELQPTSIRTLITPCYQNRYKPARLLLDEKKLEISYGCIGPFLNPDELNFIKELCDISRKTNVQLTIIQHPKFFHDFKNVDLEKIEVKTFDYLNSTLTSYYTFLATQNFVIASGTTLALDALFVGTPVLGLEFEIQTQDFWSSHLRSYDVVPHTMKLFENYQIPRLRNKVELIEYLSGKKLIDLDQYFNFDLEFITGDEHKIFIDELINAISYLV